MMYAFAQSMQDTCSASAMCAEEAFSACAFLLLGSAILAESIFVVLISIWLVSGLILLQKSNRMIF